MSDPVVNIEIEDVLASIRRLVSEGDAPRKGATDLAKHRPAVQTPTPPAPEPAAVQAPESNKLVLSPDQMVESPQRPDVAPLVLDGAASVRSEQPADAPEPTSVPTGDVLPPMPEPSGMAVWHNLDPLPDLPATEDPAPEAPMIEDAEEVTDADSAPVNLNAAPESDAPQSSRAQLLSTIEELEAAVTDSGTEFEPDGSEVAPVVDWERTTENGAIFGARASKARLTETRPIADADDGDNASETSVPPMPSSSTLSEVRRLAREEINRATVASLDDEIDEFIAAETAVDQAELRDMVVAIVREELQGALGERITRNVRKLVRREIYRVLATEDFN